MSGQGEATLAVPETEDEGEGRLSGSGEQPSMSGNGDRPKLLFVSYTADWRGPTLSLIHLLDRLDERGYRLGVAHAGTGGFADAVDERGIERYPFDRLDKWSIPELAGVIRGHEFDLVYANATHGASRNASLAAVLAGTPFVCHVRAMGTGKGWTRLGYLWLADAVIAVSDACAESVRRFVRGDRLHRVYNGVPLGDPEGAVADGDRPNGREEGTLREEIDAGPSDTVLLSVSHICRRKGQANVVRAMPDIVREVSRTHLCLVGATDREPDYTRELRDLSARLGIEDRVHLLGFRQDVPALLQEADLFVHTALADPHPRAVIEAMHAGLPVVAFSVDGVAETVVDGRTGKLVDPGSPDGMARAVVELARSPETRRRMGKAGRRRGEEHFTADRTADEIAGILDGILEGRSRAHAIT